MKNVKNDTRYIIKRILIGVGIAILLFNLKKCNAYALSYESYIQSTNNMNAGFDFYTREWTETQCNNLGYSNNMRFITFTYEDIKYSFCYSGSSQTSNPTPFLISYLYEDNIYISYGEYNSQNLPYLNMNLSNSNLYYNYTNTLDIIPPLQTISSVNRGLLKLTGATITRTNKQILSPATLYENNNYENLRVIYNSTPYQLTINQDYNVPDVPTDPLANYTQIDLTGYQAVLLVPKNYQTMLSDSSHTNESPPGTFRTYLDLEYYSQECVRGTLINVENVQDIMLNNIGVGTGNIAESVTGTCYQEPTQTIMSYEFDQYSGLKARGLLIYNGSQDWQSGFGTETPFFGTSYVWYNPTMYNAYLVESFDNFNQTISYKDYSGEDQEVTIKSLPTFTESMENAIDNVDSPTPTEVNRQKLQAIFDFLKTPFTFINKLNTTSCSAIVFPLPFVNKNLTLECMSIAVYNRYLPTILKTFIITILNGLIFYRCTLNNIDIFTNILDPEDNKLEAIDL